jgi:RNA polymerase sigma-70 factor (ECF subfamily)
LPCGNGLLTQGRRLRRPLYAEHVTIGRRRAVPLDVNAVSTPLDAPPARTARPTFDEVATAHLDAVYGYLVFLTGDRSAAEDLTAETFEKAFRTWRRFDPRRGSPRTWLCQIARTSAIDWFRAEARRKKREETYSRDLDHATELIDGLPGPLEQAVRELSPAEREVVALRVLLELDGPSAARVLGISQTACSTRLSRALKNLEERIDHVRE